MSREVAPRVTREVWCPKCKCLTLTSSKKCLWCDGKVMEEKP